MIRRFEPTTCNIWTRAVFSLFVENTSVSKISELMQLSCTNGSVLPPEVSECFFDADGVVCYWMLRSVCDSKATAEEHCEQLLGLLIPRREVIDKLLTEGAHAELNVCVLGPDFAVPFCLSKGLIRKIAELGLRVRVFFTGEKRWVELAASLDFGAVGDAK